MTGSGPTDELLVGVETNVTPDDGVSAMVGAEGTCGLLPSFVVDVEFVKFVELVETELHEEQNQWQHCQ